MADVRSMLKQQRAARQQAKAPKQSAPANKKRKAAEDTPDERKRTRTEEQAGVPAGFFDQATAQEADAAQPDAPDAPEAPAAPATPATPGAPAENTLQLPEPGPDVAAPVDDAELDAFMAEMEQAAPAPRHNPIAYAGAVIESAPMTAAQLAAQAKEDKAAQRAQRDEEMENEKEDAARALEDEFEEMDGLEERVKRLREQREALRTKPSTAHMRQDAAVVAPSQPRDEDSESEDEDWDDWRFRPA